VKHEKFNYDSQEYDIALIKINENIDFKKYKFLHPVCVPDITDEIQDKCYATGFGSQDESNYSSNNTFIFLLINFNTELNTRNI
jgi:hypothetical protein